MAEIGRIRERFLPLVAICKERGIAMRIGTNHGSLSDRIMNRYGDSPLGMVESAIEFAGIAREAGYYDLVFSMKASNPKVMVAAYRLLVDRMDELGFGWNYPLHLGVTEAGDGEDGRIKSAIGIEPLIPPGFPNSTCSFWLFRYPAKLNAHGLFLRLSRRQRRPILCGHRNKTVLLCRMAPRGLVRREFN